MSTYEDHEDEYYEHVAQSQEPVTFEDVVVIRQTDKAMLLNIEGTEVWLPKSQIQLLKNNTIRMPQWLAEKKDLV